MAKGQKYNDDIKEQAFALLATNNNCQYVADKLGLPYTTVKTWEKQFLAKCKNDSLDGITNSNEQNLVEARNKKKLEFIDSSWENIKLADQLIKRRLKRALEQEDEIDGLLNAAMEELDDEDKTNGRSNFKKRQRVCGKIDALRLENISQISTTLGTLYDKSALANGEATSREEQIVKKFEDF